MLAQEEASAPSKAKAAPKAGTKKAAAKVAPKPAGPGAIAAGGGLDPSTADVPKAEEPETFSATGLDNALDLLEVVTAKTDKASVGQRAAGIEQHPEVRMRALSRCHRGFIAYGNGITVEAFQSCI